LDRIKLHPLSRKRVTCHLKSETALSFSLDADFEILKSFEGKNQVGAKLQPITLSAFSFIKTDGQYRIGYSLKSGKTEGGKRT
jgi:hypothetical protein